MKVSAIWKQGEGTVWYGPEPEVVSSAGAGNGRKEVKYIEERTSSEDTTERFRGSSQEWEEGMVSKEVRKAAADLGGPSLVGHYLMYSSKVAGKNSCVLECQPNSKLLSG